MSEYRDLKALPADDLFRNTELSSIQAECRLHGTERWVRIEAGWAISKVTFNQLNPSIWVHNREWRVPV